MLTVPPRSRGRLLVAEDDAAIARLIASMCRHAGYDVHTVADGTEALDWLAANRAELVILDVRMPRLDGIDVTRRLRASDATAKLPILIVTALALPGERRMLEEAGADAVIIKPFVRSHLLACIEAHCQRAVGP